MKNILVFCAHPDDELIGLGGTIAKYSQENYNIIVVIFSYGELSYYKEEIIKKKRYRESKEASKILGSRDVIVLGLPDGKIKKSITPEVIKSVRELILKYNPERIYTHTPSDPLPDHIAVYNAVMKALKSIKRHYDVYGFDVWNLTNLKERNFPVVYVDVSETLWKKMKCLWIFRTQFHVMLYFFPIILARAIYFGLKNHCRYAERFYKLK